ncbi:MAG: hypothetical protein RLY14_1938, partial [Planctomycetota bacterium]
TDFPRFLKNDPKLIQAIIVFGLLLTGYSLFKVFKNVNAKMATTQQEERVAAPKQATPSGKTLVETQKLQPRSLSDLVPRFHLFPESLSSLEAAEQSNCFTLGFDNWTLRQKTSALPSPSGQHPFYISDYVTVGELMFVFDEATVKQISESTDRQQVNALIEKSLSKLNCKISEDNPQQDVLDRAVLVPPKVADDYCVRLTLRCGFNYQYRLPTSSHASCVAGRAANLSGDLLPVQEHLREESSHLVSAIRSVSHSSENGKGEKIKRFRIIRTSQVELENAFSVELFDVNP